MAEVIAKKQQAEITRLRGELIKADKRGESLKALALGNHDDAMHYKARAEAAEAKVGRLLCEIQYTLENWPGAYPAGLESMYQEYRAALEENDG